MNVAQPGPRPAGAVPPAADVHGGSLLAQCFDAMPSPIKTMNKTGLITFYNRAAFQYFGPRIAWARSPAERDSLFHPNDLPRRKAARERVLHHGESIRVELRAMRFDYCYRWHAFDLTPLFAAASTVSGLLVVMTDIHDGHAAGNA